jgi:hypothetical protein
MQHHKCEYGCLGDISVTHKNIDILTTTLVRILKEE